MPDVSRRFGIVKPMLIVPRFYHIHRRSGANIVAASGHIEVKNCTKICFFQGSGELTALPQTPLTGEEGLAAPSAITPPTSPFRPRLIICPPLRIHSDLTFLSYVV